jgi:pSer/pThr/pTyr-binding forkhead associated (FHA) protein
MNTRTWTIGFDSSCDIVVERPTVSGVHCRLTFDGQRFVLEDLQSTNGTFCNGERLIAPKAVTSSDHITLGQGHVLTWPSSHLDGETLYESWRQSSPAGTELVISIGRSPENNVVVNQPDVSSLHAKLTCVGTSIVLEDLDSSNGTGIGTQQNRIKRTTVAPHEVAYIGSSPFPISKLLDLGLRARSARRDGAIDHAQPFVRQAPLKTNSASRNHVPMILAVIAIVVSLSFFFIRSNELGEPKKIVMNAPPSESKPTETDASSDSTTAVVDPATPSDAFPTTPAKTATNESIETALFVIVCRDPENKTPFRVGTAFAINDHQVVTCAAVVGVIKELRTNGFPTAVLFSPKANRELPLGDVRIHKSYEPANLESIQALNEHEELMEETKQNPPPQEKIESIKLQLQAIRDRVIRAMDRKMTFDVAVIDVPPGQNSYLDGIDSTQSLRPNLGLRLAGYPFEFEDAYFDSTAALTLTPLPCRLRNLGSIEPNAPARLLVTHSGDLRQVVYLGSPILNMDGRVVALFSRPAPSETATDQPLKEMLFEGPVFERVRECLAQPVSQTSQPK